MSPRKKKNEKNQRKKTDERDRIIDGRIFRINKTHSETKRFLVCSTMHCHAKGEQNLIDGLWIATARANSKHAKHCLSSKFKIRKAEFEKALKDALYNNYYDLKKLYDATVLLYPEVKMKISFNDIQPKMVQWRKHVFPPNPDSFDKFVEQLINPDNASLLQSDQAHLKAISIVDKDSEKHIAFYDAQIIETEFSSVTKLLVDGTFQTTPEIKKARFQQLVVIMGVKCGHAFPLVFSLLVRKTENAYNALFESVIEKKLINPLQIQILITDFETALRNAAKTNFPLTRCVGCNVHMDRAVYKKLNNLKLQPYLQNNEEAKTFVKKVLLLAYLPPEHVKTEFSKLVENLDRACVLKLKNFIQYFNNFWIKTVGPLGFTVFGILLRTTNAIESFNSELAYVLKVHSKPWAFLRGLVNLIENVYKDLTLIRNGRRISRNPRYSTKSKQQKIIDVWSKYARNEITVSEIPELLLSFKGKINARILKENEDCRCGNCSDNNDIAAKDRAESERRPNASALLSNTNNVDYREDPEFDEGLKNLLSQMNDISPRNDELSNPTIDVDQLLTEILSPVNNAEDGNAEPWLVDNDDEPPLADDDAEGMPFIDNIDNDIIPSPEGCRNVNEEANINEEENVHEEESVHENENFDEEENVNENENVNEEESVYENENGNEEENVNENENVHEEESVYENENVNEEKNVNENENVNEEENVHEEESVYENENVNEEKNVNENENVNEEINVNENENVNEEENVHEEESVYENENVNEEKNVNENENVNEEENVNENENVHEEESVYENENVHEEESVNENENVNEEENVNEKENINEEENVNEKENINDEENVNEGGNFYEEENSNEEEKNTIKQQRIDLLNETLRKLLPDKLTLPGDESDDDGENYGNNNTISTAINRNNCAGNANSSSDEDIFNFDNDGCHSNVNNGAVSSHRQTMMYSSNVDEKKRSLPRQYNRVNYNFNFNNHFTNLGPNEYSVNDESISCRQVGTYRDLQKINGHLDEVQNNNDLDEPLSSEYTMNFKNTNLTMPKQYNIVNCNVNFDYNFTNFDNCSDIQDNSLTEVDSNHQNIDVTVQTDGFHCNLSRTLFNDRDYIEQSDYSLSRHVQVGNNKHLQVSEVEVPDSDTEDAGINSIPRNKPMVVPNSDPSDDDVSNLHFINALQEDEAVMSVSRVHNKKKKKRKPQKRPGNAKRRRLYQQKWSQSMEQSQSPTLR